MYDANDSLGNHPETGQICDYHDHASNEPCSSSDHIFRCRSEMSPACQRQPASENVVNQPSILTGQAPVQPQAQVQPASAEENELNRPSNSEAEVPAQSQAQIHIDRTTEMNMDSSTEHGRAGEDDL
jgi:hypothetical protein